MCQESYCPFLYKVHSSYLNLKDSIYFSKYTFPRWVDKRRSEVQGERIASKESEKEDIKLVKRDKLVYLVAFLTNTEII